MPASLVLVLPGVVMGALLGDLRMPVMARRRRERDACRDAREQDEQKQERCLAQ
jgi:hypothetical protein